MLYTLYIINVATKLYTHARKREKKLCTYGNGLCSEHGVYTVVIETFNGDTHNRLNSTY